MSTTRKLYEAIASAVVARENCARSGNAEWLERWTARLKRFEREELPRGSGFDSGTTINLEKSNSRKLVFETAFHHMNEGGMYDGWTEHTVTATANLLHGFGISVSGRDRNGIKDYIAEEFMVLLDLPTNAETRFAEDED